MKDIITFIRDNDILGINLFDVALTLAVLLLCATFGYLLNITFKKIHMKKEHSIINESNIKMFCIMLSIIAFKYTLMILDARINDTKFYIKIVNVIILISLTSILRSIVNTIKYKYSVSNEDKTVGGNSFFELINLLIVLISIIISISILFNISTGAIFGTLGALTAVLVLIFKDIILGFVAGMQIYQNKVYKAGDWIEIPNNSVDGTIVEINLINAKIQNWDKTMVIIPTYLLVSTGIINYKNMKELNVRRIKKSISIDIDTIRFLTEDEYDTLKNSLKCLDNIDYKMVTNVTMFRIYAESFLNTHRNISGDETITVRLIQPTNFGVPIEFYCFSNTSDWKEYENIQSEIIEYLIAILHYFKLKCFQSPRSGT